MSETPEEEGSESAGGEAWLLAWEGLTHRDLGHGQHPGDPRQHIGALLHHPPRQTDSAQHLPRELTPPSPPPHPTPAPSHHTHSDQAGRHTRTGCLHVLQALLVGHEVAHYGMRAA